MPEKKAPPGPFQPGKKSFHAHVERTIAHNTSNPEARKSLHITYQKMNGRTVKRRVDPLSMRGNTLVAWDHKRKAHRSFRMERVKHMEKMASFFAGFEKRANAAAELVGLGTLAAPSIQHLRGKPMDERTAHKTELAGLGILAAPYAASAAKSLVHKVAPGLRRAI